MHLETLAALVNRTEQTKRAAARGGGRRARADTWNFYDGKAFFDSEAAEWRAQAVDELQQMRTALERDIGPPPKAPPAAV